MLRLVIEDGEGTTHVVPLIRDEITVGREEGNTIRLTERNVSRRHARLVRNGADETMTVLVQDLDSYNGVRVNGNRIVGQCSLAADDTIQIGDYLLALEAKPLEVPDRQDVTRVTALLEPSDTTAPLQEENRGRLVVVSSNLAGQEYHLTEREMVLGRTDDIGVQLVVNHRSISANHAKFVCRDGRFTVIDMASANGLIVNGQAMTTTNLVNGDILEMGHVKFRFSGAGDDYQFSPADIDDVVLPPSDRLARLLVMALFFVGIALTGYVITDGLQDSDLDDVDVEEATVTQPNEPPKPPNPTTVEIYPDSSAEGTELTRVIQSGHEAKRQQRWADAQKYFRRALELDPKNQDMLRLDKSMGDELRNEVKWKKFHELVKDKKYSSALELAKKFDQSSDYYPDVDKTSRDARRLLVDQVRSKVAKDLKKQRFNAARDKLERLARHQVDPRELNEIRRDIRMAENDAQKAALAQIEVPSTPEPSKASTPRRTEPQERVKTASKPKKDRARKPKTEQRKRAGGGCEEQVMALQTRRMRREIQTRTYSKQLGQLSAKCRKHKKTQKIACYFFLKGSGSQYEKPCKRYEALLSSTSQKNALKQKIRKMRRNANSQ